MKRMLIAGVMVLGFATAMVGQRGPRPAGPPPADGAQRPDPAAAVAAVKEALSLTDAQLESINALKLTRQQRAEVIFAEIQQNRQALDTQLNAATPNATAVGNAAIALHASQKKLEAERDWYFAELKKLLTGEQQTTLDTLIASQSRLLGVLGLGMPGPRGGFGRGPGR